MADRFPKAPRAVRLEQAQAQCPGHPNYAWPSYAPYPNFSAVGYPTAYPWQAWPNIGPFYPYPEVPLDWRAVTLRWDDGIWWLDFKKHYTRPFFIPYPFGTGRLLSDDSQRSIQTTRPIPHRDRAAKLAGRVKPSRPFSFRSTGVDVRYEMAFSPGELARRPARHQTEGLPGPRIRRAS